MSASAGGPLDGIGILDFSHALAGPYATLLMADYGATVYKLEAPGGSDMGRGWGPPFIGGEAAFFLGLNRGKRGISIDLKKREGIELCLRLLDRMDVLIENFRPGTMDRLGLGYSAVHARNPRLVYCSISGYGQDGPSREEAAMDLIVQCSSGLVSITGSEDGEVARCGFSVADISAGMFAAIGILMALRARERSGEGQFVDVAMQDCMISTMTSNFMTYLASGQVPGPLGTGFATVAPYRVFEGSDRGFSIAIGSEKLWASFCRAIERPDLETHPDSPPTRRGAPTGRRSSGSWVRCFGTGRRTNGWKSCARWVSRRSRSATSRTWRSIRSRRSEGCFRRWITRLPGRIGLSGRRSSSRRRRGARERVRRCQVSTRSMHCGNCRTWTKTRCET